MIVMSVLDSESSNLQVIERLVGGIWFASAICSSWS